MKSKRNELPGRDGANTPKFEVVVHDCNADRADEGAAAALGDWAAELLFLPAFAARGPRVRARRSCEEIVLVC